jgi:hypothetical protein
MKLRQQEVTLGSRAGALVAAYLDSIRDPILRHLGEPFDFNAIVADVAARIDRVITEARVLPGNQPRRGVCSPAAKPPHGCWTRGRPRAATASSRR